MKKCQKLFNVPELQHYQVTAPHTDGGTAITLKGQQAVGRLWFIQYSEGMAYSSFLQSKRTFSQAEFFASLVPQQIALCKLIQALYLQLKQFSARKC